MDEYRIPDHLIGGGGCEAAQQTWGACRWQCAYAVRQHQGTGAWFITMGHPGFNSRANNREGYTTRSKALAAVRRYGGMRKAGEA